MISLADIKSECTNEHVYARGRALAQGGPDAIIDRRASFTESDPQYVSLTASVISSHEDYYDVEITLEGDLLDEAFCECPAFEKYAGICKHCAATLIAYRKQPDSFLEDEDEGVVYGRSGRDTFTGSSTPGASASKNEFHTFEQNHDTDYIDDALSWLETFLANQHGVQRGFPPRHDSETPSTLRTQPTGSHGSALPHHVETSPLLQQFMNQYAPAAGFVDYAELQKNKLPQRLPHVKDEEPTSNVYLEATITENSLGWLLSLRVGHDKNKYVVKNIFDLLECVINQRWCSYGQKLAFVHNLTTFDPKSRALVGLLLRKLESEQEQKRLRFGRHADTSTTFWDKTVLLTDAETVELLDIHQKFNEPLFIQDPSLYGNGKQSVQVVREDPTLELDLYPTEHGWLLDSGAEKLLLSTSNRLFILHGAVFYDCSYELAELAPLLKRLYGNHDKLLLSQEDAAKFAASLLPIFDDCLTLHAPEEIRALKPLPCELEFYFDRDKKRVTCEVYALYGSRRVALTGVRSTGQPEGVVDPSSETEPRLPLRDFAKESDALSLLEGFFTTDMAEASKAGAAIDEADVPFISLDDELHVADLLFGGLARFKELGTVFTTDAFNRLLFERTPTINIGLSLTGDLLDLDVSSSDLSPDELGAVLNSYKKRRSFHRLKSGAYLNLQDMNLHQFQQLDQLSQDLGLSSTTLTAGHAEVPLARAFYLDNILGDESKDASFAQFLERFHQLQQTAYDVPASLENVLRPYQVEGFQWLSLLAASGFGGILADEMGLGKTLQIIAWLLSQQEALDQSNPALIVCPASVVYNWVAEIQRFAPTLSVQALAGTKAERNTARKIPAHVYIISYDSARLDVEALKAHSWFALILDEAHYIKNQSAKTTQALKQVEAAHKFALTGTPMENRPSELYSLFAFLMPGYLGSYMSFRERFELGILGGDEETALRLHALVSPFILRRLKADVLTELPEKLESVIRTPLTTEQRKLYLAEEQHIRTELALQIAESKQRRHQRNTGAREHSVEILAELTKLRQICCDPRLVYENYSGGAAKVDAIMDVLASAQDSGEKVLLFSQFTSFLSVIETRLMKEHIPYFVLTGATPKERRLELCNAFNQDQTPVFLISLKAGGVGLNLTGASVVIHADPWWNASAQNQATDRAHRIGQERTVTVYKIIAAGTIEERIVTLQEKKLSLADSLIGGESLSLGKLSDEELLALLSGGEA